VSGDLKPRLEGLIDVFGLQRHSNFLPGQLSRGLRQKTQLACTFVRPFSLLILDEPSAGLDPPAKAKLKEMLVELTSQDRGVLFTTHELDLAQGLAHRAIILTDGRIIADGEFDAISRAWLDQLGSS
jgi:ABC-2 type transport system ATP-binding protein